MRQTTLTHARAPEPDLSGVALTTMPGQRLDTREAARHQLFFALRGGMRVSAQGAVWSVAPGRALWLPAGEPHEIMAIGRLALRTLSVRRELWPAAPEEGRLITVSPLLRELLLFAVAEAPLQQTVPQDAAILLLLERLVEAAPSAPIRIPLPADGALTEIADQLRQDPAGRLSVEELAAGAGLSRRTLERRVREATGLSFQRWRARFRAAAAIEALAAGDSSAGAMAAAGYTSPSAFIEMFRREVGVTPSQFAANSADDRAGPTAL